MQWDRAGVSETGVGNQTPHGQEVMKRQTDGQMNRQTECDRGVEEQSIITG